METTTWLSTVDPPRHFGRQIQHILRKNVDFQMNVEVRQAIQTRLARGAS
jgi:hypothetical protein